MFLQSMKRRMGVVGSFAYSAANFFLAFLLQSSVPGLEFGLYAFALVLLQFGTGISNALFASPIVLWLEDPALDKGALLGSFFAANLVFIGAGNVAVVLILLAMGMPGGLVALVGAQACFFWMRWFVRAVELAQHNFVQSALADLTYGLVTFGVGAALFGWAGVEVRWALLAMLVGTMASLAVVGRGMFDRMPGRVSFARAPFLEAFRRHGGWALVGVSTTEITANLHSYVLTVWLGPAAFAPVATLSLFFRPIPILMQSLTQYERPVLARWLREGKFDLLDLDVRKITAIMSGAVVLNTLAVAAIIAFAGALIGNGQYPAPQLWPILVLLAAGQLVRALRTGPSAAAQGAGMFRPLAFATVYASVVTLVGTAIALLFAWQVVPMVLSAVLAGEIVTAILIRVSYRKIGRAGGRA